MSTDEIAARIEPLIPGLRRYAYLFRLHIQHTRQGIRMIFVNSLVDVRRRHGGTATRVWAWRVPEMLCLVEQFECAGRLRGTSSRRVCYFMCHLQITCGIAGTEKERRCHQSKIGARFRGTLSRRHDHRHPWQSPQEPNFADPCKSLWMAKKVSLIYDPLEPSDRRQVDLLPAGIATLTKVPLVGHATPVWLSKMGLLKELCADIFNDRFDNSAFRSSLKRRRDLARYYVQMGNVAGDRRPRLREWCDSKAELLGVSKADQTEDAKAPRASLLAEKEEADRLQLQRDQSHQAAAHRARSDAAVQARETRVREHEQLKAERAAAADLRRKTLKDGKPPKNQ